jgi:hypothetical protein
VSLSNTTCVFLFAFPLSTHNWWLTARSLVVACTSRTLCSFSSLSSSPSLPASSGVVDIAWNEEKSTDPLDRLDHLVEDETKAKASHRVLSQLKTLQDVRADTLTMNQLVRQKFRVRVCRCRRVCRCV